MVKACYLTIIMHHPTSPKNPRTLETMRGIGQLTMAFTLVGSREIPSFKIMNPKQATLSHKESALALFSI